MPEQSDQQEASFEMFRDDQEFRQGLGDLVVRAMKRQMPSE